MVPCKTKSKFHGDSRVGKRGGGEDIQEPAVLGADGHAEDQIEALVEGGVASGGVGHGPRVCQKRLVLGHAGEAAEVVERAGAVEADKHDLVGAAVDVEVDVAGGPLDAERVEAAREVAAAEHLCVGGAPVAVLFGRGTLLDGCLACGIWRSGEEPSLTPVEGAVVVVAAAFGVGARVASRFHDVDLAAARPFAVGGGLGHHPLEAC